MNNPGLLVIAVIAGLVLDVLSNWLFEIAKEKGILPPNPNLKRFLLTLLFFVPLVILIVWLPNSTQEQPTPTNQASPTMTVKRISKVEIEVSLRNLPLSQNPYLMISDHQRVYNPIKILDSPEKERIVVGEGITWVVIILVSDNVSSIEQIDGVEIEDPRIHIIAQAPIPEK